MFSRRSSSAIRCQMVSLNLYLLRTCFSVRLPSAKRARSTISASLLMSDDVGKSITLLLIIVSAHLQTAFPCRQRAIFAWREITITEPTLIHLDDNDDPSRIFLAPRSSNRWCIGMGCVPSIEGGHPKTTGKTLLGTSRVYFASQRLGDLSALKCVSGLLLRTWACLRRLKITK